MDDFYQSCQMIRILRQTAAVFGIMMIIVCCDDTPLLADMVMSDPLCQSFIVGIPNAILDEETRLILEEIKPAGIVLYKRNIQSFEQTRRLIQELQNFALSSTGYPYFIMLDEEPGGAGRLKVFRYVFPGRTPDWSSIDHGIKVMAEVGINVDLAPLADFPINKKAFIMDRVPPSGSPKELIAFNRQFLELLHRYRIAGTLKHFPGLGVFIQDPHQELAETSVEKPFFEESLKLFAEGISDGADFVMTGHSYYPNIDSGQPTTLSKILVTDILKNKLKYKGLIMTDDLSEMPVTTKQALDKDEIAYRALMAGHHLLMYSHGLEKTRLIFRNLQKKIGQDIEMQKRLYENYNKIIAFKKDKLKPYIK